MAEAPETDNDALIAVLRREEDRADSWQGSELTALRVKALNYYDRLPLGDEQEGQSKVVTSEFADTIEAQMPGLMAVFASTDQVVEFAPIEESDVQSAEEATGYVQHVLMRQNPGFRILSWFFKDALMSRLGGVAVDAEEVKTYQTDPIEGWTEEQMAAAEEMAREKGAAEVEFDVQPDAASPYPAGEAQTGATFSGSIRLTRKRKRVVVDNIAPEDILFTPGVRSLDEASFVGYRKRITASELRELGVKGDDIDELSSESPISSEAADRDPASPINDDRTDSERPLWLVLAYVKFDDDGDGMSETLRVLYAHAGGRAAEIIEREEWTDREPPVTIGSPILMPNSLIGRSVFDQTKDLQDIGTALTRGMLDNVYLTNRPRPAISGKVDINSVIDWTPGMPIQMEGNDKPSDHIDWLQVPSVIGPALQTLEYFQAKREDRTGTTRQNQGLEADSLNKTFGGMKMLKTMGQQRQALVARTFAEMAVTKLMRDIYRAIKRVATGPIKYFNGEDWASCDPTKWPDDMHMSVSVGEGTGDREQELGRLQLIAAGQKELIAAQGGGLDGPFITRKHVANTFRKIVKAAGFAATTTFIAADKEIEAAPLQQGQQPSPEMAVAQAQIAVMQQAAQAEIETKKAKAQADVEIARQKAQAQIEIERFKAGMKASLDSQELEHETSLKALKIATDQTPGPGATEIQQQGA